MAGLLNLIPRYLPRFGMAPEWARASRPLVLVFMGIATLVTLLFRADVDAQGGAYATGVLVLITSASVAVMLSVWRNKVLRLAFIFTTAIFVYTTIVNMFERPEGLKIASLFILAILVTSIYSRAVRSVELRITGVTLDQAAADILAADDDQLIRLVARGPEAGDQDDKLAFSDRKVRYYHNLSQKECLIFFEVNRGDASEFAETINIKGRRVGRHSILSTDSPVVANSIAAMLLFLRDRTGQVPHVYFRWTEASPLANLARFFFSGEGDAAPLTQEVLRRAVPNPEQRPVVHVS